MDLAKKIGAAIKRIRNIKGLSQEDVGLSAGVTRLTVRNIEEGKDVRLSSLKKVADSVGYNLRITFKKQEDGANNN